MIINTVKLQADGFLVNGYETVPSDGANLDYCRIQEWINDGNTPDPEFTQSELDNKIINAERDWRNKELMRVDIEIRKVEDPLESFNALDWRRHAVLLRDWPDSIDFPDSTKRPVAPDAV